MNGVKRDREGREPMNARSATALRAVFATLGLLIGVAGAVWFWWLSPEEALVVGAGFALLALIAVGNLVVLVRRH